MKKFLFGAIVGACAGMLLAPKKGKELREDIMDTFDDLLDRVKDFDVEETKYFLADRINELKAELYDIDKEKIKELSRDAYELVRIKAEQLYEYSKMEGFPMLVDKSKGLIEDVEVRIRGLFDKECDCDENCECHEDENDVLSCQCGCE